MWYLSKTVNRDIKNLSLELLNFHGWEDQFSVTKKVLHQYSAVVDFFNSENLNKNHKYDILKHAVDALIVTWHPGNYLKIKDNDFLDIAINGYTVGGDKKEPKIPRNYRKVLGQEYIAPAGKFDLQYELDKMSGMVIGKKIQELGVTGGLKFQNSIASEEAGELTKELSKYYRDVITGDKYKINQTRTAIIDEMYDTLYTMRYVFISAEISQKELENYARIRVPEIRTREILYKKR